jgi:hypothetical protein
MLIYAHFCAARSYWKNDHIRCVSHTSWAGACGLRCRFIIPVAAAGTGCAVITPVIRRMMSLFAFSSVTSPCTAETDRVELALVQRTQQAARRAEIMQWQQSRKRHTERRCRPKKPYRETPSSDDTLAASSPRSCGMSHAPPAFDQVPAHHSCLSLPPVVSISVDVALSSSEAAANPKTASTTMRWRTQRRPPKRVGTCPHCTGVRQREPPTFHNSQNANDHTLLV